MTNIQARKEFKAFVHYAPKGMNPRWRGEAWVWYSDMLYETKKITWVQWNTWKNPY